MKMKNQKSEMQKLRKILDIFLIAAGEEQKAQKLYIDFLKRPGLDQDSEKLFHWLVKEEMIHEKNLEKNTFRLKKEWV